MEKRSWMVVLVVFVLVNLACKRPSTAPQMESEEKTGGQTGKPVEMLENLVEELQNEGSRENGTSRQSPLPLDTLAVVPGWEIKVVEFLRGEDALAVIQSGSRQMEGLPAGKAFALAKFFVRCTAADAEPHSIGLTELFITGSSHLVYGDTMDGWPQPEFLYEDMYTAEAVEGWIDAVIPEDEENLMAVLDLEVDGTRYTRFFALQEDASITLPEESNVLQPNEAGLSMENPAEIDEEVVTPEWEITLLDALRGNAAKEMIREDGDSDDAQKEYLLLKVRLHYFGTADLPTNISQNNFYAVDNGGNTISEGWVRVKDAAERPWINNTVLPGAKLEGWVAVDLPAGISQPLAAFDPDLFHSDSSGLNIRYFVIE